MIPSINELQPFDVLIAIVRFEGMPKGYKARPVVVLNINDNALTIAALKVTSHAPREWCPGEVQLLDWEQEGLLQPSVVRCSQLFELYISDIGDRIGHLSERDQEAVASAIKCS